MHQFTNIHAHKLYYYMLQSNTWILLGPWLSEIDINSRRHTRIILDAIRLAEAENKDILLTWISAHSFDESVTGRWQVWIIRFFRKSIKPILLRCSRFLVVERPHAIPGFSVPHKLGRCRLYGGRQAKDKKNKIKRYTRYYECKTRIFYKTLYSLLGIYIDPGPLPLGLSKY